MKKSSKFNPRSSWGQSSRLQKGFSLVELIFIMSLMALLLGLTTINLSGAQRQAILKAVVQDLISDVRQQQIKTMIGDTEGRPSPDSYGVHIDSNQYVLFHGTYSVGEPTNFPVNLPQNFEFEHPVPDIIFAKISGELSAASNVTLKDTTSNNIKTIQINRYGVITGVN